MSYPKLYLGLALKTGPMLYFDARFIIISDPAFAQSTCALFAQSLFFPSLMASDSVETADVASKITQ